MRSKILNCDHSFGGIANREYFRRLKAATACLSIILLLLVSTEAQDYPKEIRGYKVYKTKISVKNESEKSDTTDDAEALVTLGEPKVASFFVTGVTMEMSVKMAAIDQSGTVDFLTFENFKVNGIDVDIEEYTESFSFEKNKPVELPKPIKVFIGTGQALMGGLGEMRDSKEEWDVTGTVFIFGKFKKLGFSFKRVIPVEVSVKIKNPMKKPNPNILPF